MKAHKFYISFCSLGAVRFKKGGGSSVELIQATVLTGKDFFLLLCAKALKMMSLFFNGCPEGGHTRSALCSQKLGRAGIWNMPGACAIPFPALVSLSHKSHVSSHLFIDCKCLPLHSKSAVCVQVYKRSQLYPHRHNLNM